MQERVVGILKDIWETLKKEIKGPRVYESSSKPFIPLIKDKKITKDQIVSIKSDKRETAVFEANDNITNLKVYENIIKDKSHNVEMLAESFSSKTEKMLLEQFQIATNNLILKENEKKIEDIDLSIEDRKAVNISFGKFNTKVQEIKEKIETQIKNGDYVIFSIPKIIKGKYEYDFSREEYNEIVSRINRKLMKHDVYNYKIESIFKNIPVKYVKNIKFFVDKNELEVYLKKGEGDESADFVIIRSRITGVIEKIFI